MKKVIVIAMAVLLVLSCEKVKDEIDSLPNMKATIDGVEWNSLTRKTTLKDDKFIISGVSISGETIVLTAFGSTEGNYELGLLSAQMTAVYNDVEMDDISSTDNVFIGYLGEIDITEVNTEKKVISGTFSFKATRLTESIEVTNGSFKNIKYSVEE